MSDTTTPPPPTPPTHVHIHKWKRVGKMLPKSQWTKPPLKPGEVEPIIPVPPVYPRDTKPKKPRPIEPDPTPVTK